MTYRVIRLLAAMSCAVISTVLTCAAASADRIDATPSLRRPTGPEKAPSDQRFIQRWMLLEPIGAAGLTDTVVRDTVQKDHFPGQFTVVPRDGDRVKVGDAELTWHAVDTTVYNVNLFHFARALGKPTSNILVWGVTTVNCTEDLPNVRLAIGSNAASVWWVNGQEVIGIYGDRQTVIDDGISKRLTLKKGANVLRCAIINGGGATDFCARFLDEDGQPIRGYTVTVNGPNRAPQLQSPVVHSDRTVTFSVRAPNAQKVELSGQFQKANQPLIKDSNGVWSLTVGPIEPNLYPYNFVIDGIGIADSANPDLFPNERFKPSLVEIPSDPPALHSVQNVPHGEMSYAFYPSKTLNRTRPLVIYTPPGYRAETDRYPVLYLVSGTTDTEETWFRAGRLNVILDNLIAQKKAVPMIVVMPYGNMMMGTPPPSSPQAAEMYRVFNDELVGNILPYVESQFRVLAHREKRAIAGFSRGGGQSLFTAFNNLDTFAWIGSYAAYLTPEVCTQYFPDRVSKPEETNRQLKLLWLGVGTEDFLYKQASEFDQFLKEMKIDHQSLVTGGGHTWMNARHYLAETLQLFFK